MWVQFSLCCGPMTLLSWLIGCLLLYMPWPSAWHMIGCPPVHSVQKRTAPDASGMLLHRERLLGKMQGA